MREMICIVCPKGCRLQVDEKPDGEIIVMGNGCNRGIPYAKKELTNPTRVITSTVKIRGGIHKRLPVKTSTDIPKGLNFDVMRELEKIEVKAPIKVGTVLIKNVLGTGADIVATRNM
jgi:CxxC motif-containing protein